MKMFRSNKKSLVFMIAALLSTVPMFAVNVKDYGAVGDGSHDDTSAVNAAFQAGCDSSVYFPTGVYLVDPLAPLTGCSTTVYGDGYAKSIVKSSSNLAPGFQSIVSFSSSNALTIMALGFDGGKNELAGVSIDGYTTVTIRRVSSHNFGIPGYAQGHTSPYDGLYLINTANVSVNNSRFTQNERMGVELQADHDSIVKNTVMSHNGGMGGVAEQNFTGTLDGPLVARWRNNTLTGNGSGGIDVETDPSLPPAEGIMRNNVVDNCGNNNWASGWGLVIGNHAFGTVANNKVLNYAARVPVNDYSSAIVYVRNGGNITIQNNTVTGTAGYAIEGNYGLYPVMATKNTLVGNGKGLIAYSSPDITVEDNTIGNSVGAGVELDLSTPYTISGNSFFNNHPNVVIDGVTQ